MAGVSDKGKKKGEDVSPLLLLDICTKCHKWVVFMDDVCINCFVPDFIDLELVYEDK